MFIQQYSFSDPKVSAKYWSIVNDFLNKMKIPNISPLKVNVILTSDFKVRAILFNPYFTAQCTPTNNLSKLPVFKYKTEHCLNSFEINEEDI